MKYDFETLVDRSQNGSAKWNGMKDHNPAVAKNIAPLSVADLDLKLAPEIAEGMLEFMQNNPVFGYTNGTAAYYDAVINWMKDKHNYQVEKEWIVLSNGVVPALSDGVTAFTEENDGVIIFTPVYYPFYRAIELNNRRVQRCPLINHENSYQIDFDKFEELAKQANTKLLILCNPHNPVGRVWTKEELLEVAKIAERHELYIISDEIHADFVYGGKHHTPMASVSEYAMEHTITAFAPSKTFNVAGLCQSYVVIPNKKLYNAYDATYNAFDLGDNIFGMTALTAAYTKGEDWLTEMLQYLEANRDFTVEYIRENIPEISVWSPEGTYLLWLDCSKLNLENDELNQFFLEKAKVKMNPGYRFGAQCSTYMRLNIGCPRAQLQEALARIEKAIKNR